MDGLGDIKMKKISLTRGMFATVDDSDYEELSKHKWFACPNKHIFYAARNVMTPMVFLWSTAWAVDYDGNTQLLRSIDTTLKEIVRYEKDIEGS
jgi:hypothetical protein